MQYKLTPMNSGCVACGCQLIPLSGSAQRETMARHYHEYQGHAFREHVLSTLRQRFWLLQRELWFVKSCESVSAAVSEMKLLCSN